MLNAEGDHNRSDSALMNVMELNCETALPIGLTLDGLFSRGGYRPRMALKRLQPEEFFANLQAVDVLKERSALLEVRPQDFLCEPANREDTAALIQFAGSGRGSDTRTRFENSAQSGNRILYCCAAGSPLRSSVGVSVFRPAGV